MKDFKKLFVPYELALLAHENSFNENCLAKFANDKLIINHELLSYSHEKDKWNIIEAPLYQELIDWLELNYAMFIERIWNDDNNNNYILWLTKNNQYQELKSIDATLKDAFLMIKDNKIDKKYVD